MSKADLIAMLVSIREVARTNGEIHTVEHIEKILLSISHLRQDKNKWHDYVQGINEMCKEKIC